MITGINGLVMSSVNTDGRGSNMGMSLLSI